MKRNILLAILTATLALAACAIPVTDQGNQPIPLPPTAEPAPTDTPAAASTEPAAQAEALGLVVRQVLLQQLQIDFDQVSVISVEPVDWPDSCLELPAAAEMCLEAITPGYRVVLEAQEQRYEYHTNLDGSDIRLAAAPAPAIGEPIVEWRSAESPCQTALISRQGVAFGPCNGILMGGKLAADQRAPDLAYFAGLYASFEADTATGRVTLTGQGDVVASAAEQRMIAEWAQLVADEAASGRSGASWGLVLAWHREGGIAGFCDDLSVYVTGQALASSCKGAEPANLGQSWLTAAEAQQMFTWRDALASFEFEQADPASADAMTIRLIFTGEGASAAGDADKQAIQDFAARLLVVRALPTDVRYVMAQEDVTISSGPGAGYDRIGDVFEGQTALVTGVSVDGQWWRVICPDDRVGNCWVPVQAMLAQPATPPGGQSLSADDEAGIYAAAVRQVYTVDHTFGAAPNFPIIYLLTRTDDGMGDPGAGSATPQTIDELVQAKIIASVSDLPARFAWVQSREAVPLDGEGRVTDGGAIITLGNIHPQEDGSVHVAASIYVGMLVAGGQTYVLEQIDGQWQVTGNTGVIWIS